jgi:hypothetical protein
VPLDESPAASELALHGARNSLAQTLVARPGIPDFYQGSSCATIRSSIPTTVARWIWSCARMLRESLNWRRAPRSR